MSDAKATSRGKPVAIGEKVAFLRQPTVYPEQPSRIEVRETHMSWVFLGEPFVYKLKKPVRYDFLDFSTLEVRREDCEREVRLNRRLAREVYIGIVALRAGDDGGLTLEGAGTVVDWLVKMHRLPSARMLDAVIAAERVSNRDVARVSRTLTDFYRDTAEAVPMTSEAYRKRFAEDIAENARELMKPEFGLPAGELEALTVAQWQFVSNRAQVLDRRAREGRIVEGHGDLRPEHICLLPEPVIIDCLEFKRALRLLDPVDELAYLALECERLGAPEIGAEVLRHYTDATGDRVAPELVDFYKVFRACLRAKIALWHTEDHAVRDHDKWRGRARDYLAAAARYGGLIST